MESAPGPRKVTRWCRLFGITKGLSSHHSKQLRQVRRSQRVKRSSKEYFSSFCVSDQRRKKKSFSSSMTVIPSIASTRERTGAQNMFSNDVKRVRFRCQTLKFSRPNVKFPRRSLLCNSPSYINKSSSTSLRKSPMFFRLSICQWRDFRKFFTVMTANDCRGNFTLGWENFKVWHLKVSGWNADVMWKHVLCECVHEWMQSTVSIKTWRNFFVMF